MSANLQHHFVPQLHLRNFSSDPAKRRIATFALARHLYVASASIRHQAQRHKLYGTQGREQVLTDLEGRAGKVIRQIIDQRILPEPLSPEHLDLLLFTVFQAVRTPAAGEDFGGGLEKMLRSLVSTDARLGPAVERVKQIMNDPIGMAMRYSVESFPIVLDLAYKLIVAPPGVTLITSDHPVVAYNQFNEKRRHPAGGIGVACKGFQWFFPLSPQCCLVFYDPDVYKVGGRKVKPGQVLATERDAEALNALQVCNAQDQLFFPTAMSADEIRRIVGRSAHLRRREISTSQIFRNEAPRPDGSRSALVTMERIPVRTGLALSIISELPVVRHFDFAGRVVVARDKELYDSTKDFGKKMRSGERAPSDFIRFVAESGPRRRSN